jgi:hypothetical protein
MLAFSSSSDAEVPFSSPTGVGDVARDRQPQAIIDWRTPCATGDGTMELGLFPQLSREKRAHGLLGDGPKLPLRDPPALRIQYLKPMF